MKLEAYEDWDGEQDSGKEDAFRKLSSAMCRRPYKRASYWDLHPMVRIADFYCASIDPILRS
jgi:hypothetical protein